jgi:hypothetical protein
LVNSTPAASRARWIASRERAEVEGTPVAASIRCTVGKLKVVALRELTEGYHEPEREDALFESILADLDRMAGGAS